MLAFLYSFDVPLAEILVTTETGIELETHHEFIELVIRLIVSVVNERKIKFLYISYSCPALNKMLILSIYSKTYYLMSEQK